jgi:hypothetical protein
MVAAIKNANMRQGARTDLPSIGGKSAVSQIVAAKLSNVGHTSVERAAKVRAHGAPGSR